MVVYKLYVRDQNLNRVAEIEDFQSLQMIIRFNDIGSWAIELPTDCLASTELLKTKAGIIVTRNGTPIFSGPVTKRHRKWDSSGDRLIVSGYDDMVWLTQAVVYPTVNNAYDIRAGAAETVMKQYVDFNIGSNAKPERQAGISIAPNTGIGATVTGRARYDNLLELLRSLAIAGGDLGFRVVLNGTSLNFEVFQPFDKSDTVVFSPAFGNLLSFEYTSTNPTSNYVIVGGGGEGTERTIVERGDSSSITEYGRIETFVDRRDTTDSAELNQTIDEELSQKAVNTSLSISPIDTENVSFGNDYSLGDKVSILLTQANEVISDVVREVTISLNSEGETITPTVGTPDSLSHPVLSIYDKMTKIQKRVSNLERR